MNAEEEKSHFINPHLTQFQCNITTKKGEKKFTYIDLPDILSNESKAIHKDDFGNIFEYDLIGYKDEIFQPKINFKLFKINEQLLQADITKSIWTWEKFLGINENIRKVA